MIVNTSLCTILRCFMWGSAEGIFGSCGTRSNLMLNEARSPGRHVTQFETQMNSIKAIMIIDSSMYSHKICMQELITLNGI